jgi:MoaA/NifB/PqqE/SkfB family radical SAM enzyme
MGLLSKRKVPFGLSVTVMRHNWEEVSRSDFLLAAKESGAVSIQYMPYAPVSGLTDLMLTVQEREAFLHRLREQRYRSPLALMDFGELSQGEDGCRSGGLRYYVAATGDVTPCFDIGYSMGNAMKQPLAEIITSPFARDFRKLQQRTKGCVLRRAAGELIELARQHHRESINGMEEQASRLASDPEFLKVYGGKDYAP